MDTITTGTRMGLRWARLGEWRVTAYAMGGYGLSRYVDGSKIIGEQAQEIPPDIERALCDALGIPCEHKAARRYDVNAICYELDGGGSDGAYSLHAEGATPEEICANLLRVLKEGFGLENAGPCYLSIHIGPAGSSDKMPL